jgi:hypothetical protein
MKRMHERKAGTPATKVGSPGANTNIDVWVFGGKVTLTAPVGIIDEGAYGIAFGGTSRIIINGNEAALASIPAAKRMEHLHFTIAHEIGHVMTNVPGHPSESKYPLNLKWPTQRDPYLQKRLMCPGSKADSTNPGTCLIKKEWEAIEAWLKKEEDEGRL